MDAAFSRHQCIILGRRRYTTPPLEEKWLSALRVYLKHIHTSNSNRHMFHPFNASTTLTSWTIHCLKSQRFTAAQIHLLNCCRLNLRVTTISDITLPDGIRLEPHFEIGHHSLMSPKCRLHWFYQQRPPDEAWKLWQRANCLWIDKHGILKKPLGAWLFPTSQQRTQ